MKFRTVKYHVRQGLYGIMKNRIMAVAAALTVAASVFILIISFCIAFNIDYILEQLETTIGVSVFIGDDVNDEQVQNIEEKIKQVPYVTDVKYISKEDALIWASENMGNGDITKGFEDDNPLPRSFDITLENIQYQESVVTELKKIQLDFEKDVVSQKAELEYQKEFGIAGEGENSGEAESQTTKDSENSAENGASDNSEGENSAPVSIEEYKQAQLSAIDTQGYKYIGIENIKNAMGAANVLMAANTTVRVISIVLILIMSIISIGIIMNTIKLTVFVRKSEINIMKYVGATDWFIRWPFIVEGMIIGLVGAAVPCFISWIFYDTVINIIYQKVAVLQQIIKFETNLELFGFIVPISLLLGAAIGAFGSITSLKKHLNV